MAMRYHMMAVVIVIMIGALVTVPWGVNDELVAKRGLTLPTLRTIFAQIQSPDDSTIRNWGDLGLLGILNTHRRR